MPKITALYAAPLILLFLILTVRVMVLRFPKQIMIGTGGDPALERAARVHANFTEYVPLFLVALRGLGMVLTLGALVAAAVLALAAGLSR